MQTNLKSTQEMRPTMFITKNKQRVKQFDGTVYLKNGDEFELEFFNGTQEKILAKIEINNKPIGNTGIVLRPGERVFLDRYLDVSKKFLFDTYVVNGNNKEAMTAIEKNGDVVVKFFKESKPYVPTYYDGTITTAGSYYTPTTFTTPITYTTTGGITSSSASCFYSSTVPTTDMVIVPQSANTNSVKRSKSVETGRVEKGSVSDQTFNYDYTKFEYSYSWISQWKLLPESRKVVTIDDLVVFCSNCGRKRRNDKENYCPKCGNKF